AGQAATGACARQLVGEMAVDRHPADAGAFGDLTDRRCSRADRLVQLDCGLDDALPGLVLTFGTSLERVRARHKDDGTRCLLKLDTRVCNRVASLPIRETHRFSKMEGAAMSIGSSSTVSPIAPYA